MADLETINHLRLICAYLRLRSAQPKDCSSRPLLLMLAQSYKLQKLTYKLQTPHEGGKEITPGEQSNPARKNEESINI